MTFQPDIPFYNGQDRIIRNPTERSFNPAIHRPTRYTPDFFSNNHLKVLILIEHSREHYSLWRIYAVTGG